MKAFALLFLLLLGLEQMEGRRSAGEYWKHVMGDEPMPEAIAGLLVRNQEGSDPVFRGYGGDSAEMGKENWDRWIKRDFDTRSVAIIYHHHDGGDHHLHHDHQVEHHGDEAS